MSALNGTDEPLLVLENSPRVSDDGDDEIVIPEPPPEPETESDEEPPAPSGLLLDDEVPMNEFTHAAKTRGITSAQRELAALLNGDPSSAEEPSWLTARRDFNNRPDGDEEEAPAASSTDAEGIDLL
jgi:hypothetical protein